MFCQIKEIDYIIFIGDALIVYYFIQLYDTMNRVIMFAEGLCSTN